MCGVNMIVKLFLGTPYHCFSMLKLSTHQYTALRKIILCIAPGSVVVYPAVTFFPHIYAVNRLHTSSTPKPCAVVPSSSCNSLSIPTARLAEKRLF